MKTLLNILGTIVPIRSLGFALGVMLIAGCLPDDSGPPGLPGNAEGYGLMSSVARLTAPVVEDDSATEPPPADARQLSQWSSYEWDGHSGGLCEAGNLLRLSLRAAMESDRLLCMLSILEDSKQMNVKLDNKPRRYIIPFDQSPTEIIIRGDTLNPTQVGNLVMEQYMEGSIRLVLIYKNNGTETTVRSLRVSPFSVIVGQRTEAFGVSHPDGTWKEKRLSYSGVQVLFSGRYTVESELSQTQTTMDLSGFYTRGNALSASQVAHLDIFNAATPETLQLGQGASRLHRTTLLSSLLGYFAWLVDGTALLPATDSPHYAAVEEKPLPEPYEITNDDLQLHWERLEPPVETIRADETSRVDLLAPCMEKYPLAPSGGTITAACGNADFSTSP